MNYRFAAIENWPRPFTRRRRYSKFDSTCSATLTLLERELTKLGARNAVVQVALQPRDIRNDGLPRADARKPEHPGVIVSFDSKHGPLSYACDEFLDWKDNIRGIAMTLERLRLVDLYGVTKSGEQYKGWTALPAPHNGDVRFATDGDAARFVAQYSDVLTADVLGVPSAYRLAYRKAAQRLHPDQVGGKTEDFQRLQTAKEILDKRHGI